MTRLHFQFNLTAPRTNSGGPTMYTGVAAVLKRSSVKFCAAKKHRLQGAKIELRMESGVAVGSSDEQGQFRVEGNAAGGTLVVSFPGFATVAPEIRPHASTENL